MPKTRVYELAKELGTDSKSVLEVAKEMGYFVKSPSSTLEAPVIRGLREAFSKTAPAPSSGSAGPRPTPPPVSVQNSGSVQAAAADDVDYDLLRSALAERSAALDESTVDRLLRAVGSQRMTRAGYNDRPFMDRYIDLDGILRALAGPQLRRMDGLVGAVERDTSQAANTSESAKQAGLLPARNDAQQQSAPAEAPVNDRAPIFIVHGHAGELKYQVARVLDRATNRDVVILHEQPSSGRTVIEKFEHHAASAAYAVVLLTADDLGGAKSEEKQRPRARQNVVLELGFFFGALGRDRVAVLLEPGVEEPSDIAGIVYLPVDPGGAWKHDLGRELLQAGIEFDHTRVP